MKKALCLAIVLLLAWPFEAVRASGWRREGNELAYKNARFKGKVLDFTANHGQDRRIFSMALFQRRDLYVYLPPSYDPRKRYPFMIYLHGFGEDEHSFLKYVAPMLDEAICAGKLPPLVVAAPDGSLKGEPSLTSPGSFFINSKAGDFEDFIMVDVWDFMFANFSLRPERQAHILAGHNMGGLAAYDLGIRHRYCFGILIGVHPLLNLRWLDDEGHYHADFDCRKWGWRTKLNPRDVVTRTGLTTLRVRDFIEPLFGLDDGAMVELSQHNPIELIDRTRLRNGELNMYVAYGGRDEMNIDAQVESFLYLAGCRGICVYVGFDPEGKHNFTTAFGLMPGLARWLSPLLAPYSHPLPAEGSSRITLIPPKTSSSRPHKLP